MLDSDVLQRIKRIELKTRRLVNTNFAGAYHSVFKGRGIAFDAVRPYQPGDDVRDIDWNVTARTDEAFIKQYAEERELTVMLVLDSSASCLFGTSGQTKRDLAAEFGAVIALAATTNNDEVGLLIFSEKVEHFTAPRKGRNHVLRLIRDLLAARPTDKGTDLSLALQTVNKLLKKKAIIFFLSDFMAEPETYRRDLLITNRKHDLVAVMLGDPLEESWPAAGMIAVEDAESGSVRIVDTGLKQWRQQFEQQALLFRAQRDDMFLKSGVDRIDLTAHDDYIMALTSFFHRRSQRVTR